MRYAIFLKEINLSIFSFFSYLRNLNKLRITKRGEIEKKYIYLQRCQLKQGTV